MKTACVIAIGDELLKIGTEINETILNKIIEKTNPTKKNRAILFCILFTINFP